MAFVNSTSASTTGTASSIASPAINITGGNLIAVSVGTYDNTATVSGITDTAGNTYTRVQRWVTTWGGSLEIWYAKNVTGHATNVVTATFTASIANRRNIIVHQYSGRETGASVTDGDAFGNTDNSASITTASFAPTTTGCDVFSALNTQGGDSGHTAGANYTLRQTTGSTNASQDRVNAPSGSQTASISWTTNAAAILGAVAFKEAAAAPPPNEADGQGAIGEGPAASGSSQVMVPDCIGGSAIVGGLCRAGSAALSANLNTVFDATIQDTTEGSYAVAFREAAQFNSIGNITLGGSITTGFTGSIAAIEIFGWNTPPTEEDIVRHQRFEWWRRLPGRGFHMLAKPVTPTAITFGPGVIRGRVETPSSFARPRWNPPKKASVLPGLPPSIVVVTPVRLPQFTGPHFFARRKKAPSQWYYFRPVVPFGNDTGIPTPEPEEPGPSNLIATCAAPSTVMLNQTFTVICTMSNIGGSPVDVIRVEPRFLDPETAGRFGEPTLTTPTPFGPLARWKAAGIIRILGGASVQVAFGCTLYDPDLDPANIRARIFLRDGTSFTTAGVVVTPTKIG